MNTFTSINDTKLTTSSTSRTDNNIANFIRLDVTIPTAKSIYVKAIQEHSRDCLYPNYFIPSYLNESGVYAGIYGKLLPFWLSYDAVWSVYKELHSNAISVDTRVCHYCTKVISIPSMSNVYTHIDAIENDVQRITCGIVGMDIMCGVCFSYLHTYSLYKLQTYTGAKYGITNEYGKIAQEYIQKINQMTDADMSNIADIIYQQFQLIKSSPVNNIEFEDAYDQFLNEQLFDTDTFIAKYVIPYIDNTRIGHVIKDTILNSYMVKVN